MSDLNSPSTQSDFLSSPVRSGLLFDVGDESHPTAVRGWRGSRLELPSGVSHFGYAAGDSTLNCDSGSFPLRTGMYFAADGAAVVEGECGMAASLAGCRALFQLGGPIEPTGRLRYINGCSDTLLVAPAVLGDPCLNLLHIPPHTNQAAHTHPSLRVGTVVDGHGVCRTAQGDTPLTPGLVFVILTNRLHSFHTTDTALRIVAWHPDSDYGPTDERHPMVNRTLVNGQPVNKSLSQPESHR